MRKLFVLVGMIFTAALAASGVAHANHSGPEHIAKGTGATEHTISLGNASISGVTCIAETFVPSFPGDVCVVHTVITTAVSFDFDARVSSHEAGSPLGEPHGHMKLSVSMTRTDVGTGTTTTTGFYRATADVTCLTVVNNKATLSGRVTRFEGSVPPQRGLFFDVTDNTVARQQVAPDQFAGGQQPEALQACPAPTSGGPITEGNIIVEQN